MTWFQILFPLALILAPVIGQMVKKANELAEQKRIEQEKSRLREDALRTGRSPAEASATRPPARAQVTQVQGGAAARSNLEEIARRRQAELQELRRRQLAARGQPQPTAQRPPAPPRASGQIQQQPRPPQPTRRPEPLRQQPARAAKPARAPTASPRPVRRRLTEPLQAQPVAEAPRDPFARGPRRKLGTLEKLSDEPLKPKKVTTRIDIPTTMEGWRQAIVLSEILAPPVSMRSDHL